MINYATREFRVYYKKPLSHERGVMWALNRTHDDVIHEASFIDYGDYCTVFVTANTAKQCAEIFVAQCEDGHFENIRTEKETEILSDGTEIPFEWSEVYG